jgi:hypothetical protein
MPEIKAPMPTEASEDDVNLYNQSDTDNDIDDMDHDSFHNELLME